MIDPRALQQHFNKVRQKERPPKQEVPRVANIAPLTSIQAIPVPEPEQTIVQPSIDTSELQKELLEVTQALTTLKQSLTQTPQIEPVTITVPVSVVTTTNEIKINTEVNTKLDQKDNPYGYSTPKTETEKEDYNPYGYYSGPLF